MLSRELSLADLVKLRGRPVYGRDGQKVGRLDHVIYDDDTGRPEWVAIRRGRWWKHRTLAPAGGVSRREDGIRVPYPAPVLRSAPGLKASRGADPRAPFYKHYGLSSAPPDTDPPIVEPARPGAVTVRQWIESHRARLRTVVVRETLRIQRTPIREPIDGVALGEQEVVVILRDQQPSVTTRFVPKERITVERRVQGANGASAYNPPSLPHNNLINAGKEDESCRNA